jgi:hypothetical protein
MSTFKIADFNKCAFSARETRVPVPDLATFFDGEPVWVVRGLTGEELARVNEAAETARNLAAIAEGLVSPGERAKISAMRELLGLTDKVPVDLVKRIEMLLLASVAPAVDRPFAVKLADAYPIEFYTLTGEILKLTGQGKQPGKPKGSGATRPSEPPPASATSETASSSKAAPTSSPAVD